MKKTALILTLAALSATAYAQPARDTLRTAEDWEAGTFDTYRWERPQTSHRWEITTVGACGGHCCARSGNYYINKTESVLQLAVSITDSGTLSYMRKVSSEADYDFFRFYLDGELKEELSGEAGWDTFSCPVAAGFHRLKFVYHKDNSASRGSDCAWLDDISWPGAYSDAVVLDSCPVPTGLTAAAEGSGVRLEWDGGCRTYDTLIIDDIESHPYGAVNSPGAVGWSYIDGDSAATSSISAISFLGEGDTMAFVVIDDELMAGSNIVTAHSGHRYLASPFHSSIANDDWLVSPRLDFSDTFTFSFFARSYSATYHSERFLVCYSLSGCRAEDFVPLHCDTLVSTAAWEQYSFTVPASARFVAIHCVSYNEYLFCLDDLSISGRRMEGHPCNLYRDGELLATGLTGNSYCDTSASVGSHCYQLTHICGLDAESEPSDMACATVGGSLPAKTSAEEVLRPELTIEETFPQNAALDSSHMAYTLAQMQGWNRYPSYGLYVEMMHRYQQDFPQYCRVETILDSTPHPTSPHSILALHISSDPDEAADKPAFLYSSTMHGDEVTGYYLMLRLIDYILNNAETDSAVRQILQNVDLYICPLENPDGTYHLSDNLIFGSGYSRRANEAGVDLNRNYPYLPTTAGQADVQPETRAMISWMEPKHFVMSVNFHCGSEVLNLPWDLWSSSMRTHADLDWYRYVGQNLVTQAHAIDSGSYPGVSGRAILTGGDWYTCTGSRQDYANYFLHQREITIELSTTHILLDPAELHRYWNANREPLLEYALECTRGFYGTVTDAVTGEPLEALVTVLGHDRFNSEVFSHLPSGAYHRPIMVGKYRVAVTAPCHVGDTFEVIVRPGGGIRCDVRLRPCAVTPYAPSQHLLAGSQATLAALSEDEVFWYASDTACQPLAVGNIFTTPPLYETTTYWLESQHRDGTLVCVSPRDSVTVFVFDTTQPSLLSAPICDYQISDSNSFTFYPNPTTRYCHIQTAARRAVTVRIYDMQGILLRQQLLPATHTIDLDGLPAGAYFVALSENAQSLGTAKIIIVY